MTDGPGAHTSCCGLNCVPPIVYRSPNLHVVVSGGALGEVTGVGGGRGGGVAVEGRTADSGELALRQVTTPEPETTHQPGGGPQRAPWSGTCSLQNRAERHPCACTPPQPVACWQGRLSDGDACSGIFLLVPAVSRHGWPVRTSHHTPGETSCVPRLLLVRDAGTVEPGGSPRAVAGGWGAGGRWVLLGRQYGASVGRFWSPAGRHCASSSQSCPVHLEMVMTVHYVDGPGPCGRAGMGLTCPALRTRECVDASLASLRRDGVSVRVPA